MPRTPQEKTYSIYDASVDAFRSVSAAQAKLYVETADKLRAELIEDGEIEAPASV